MPDWATLLTEQQNPASERIDEVSTIEMLDIINSEDQRVPQAVSEELPHIAQAVDLVSSAFDKGDASSIWAQGQVVDSAYWMPRNVPPPSEHPTTKSKDL